jgi:hypothetical protein
MIVVAPRRSVSRGEVNAMSCTRSASLAAVIGSGLTMMEPRGSDAKALVPDDTPVKVFVAHLAKNGIKLERTEDGWWVVADPKGDGYQVVVHMQAFPANVTEQQMRDYLKQINLAFMVNAPARIVMSHPGLRATDPAKKPIRVDDVPVAAKLEKLFKEYRPPESKK